MRYVRTKGIHRSPAKLADGRKVEYRYFGKGGPRIYSEEGTAEWFAEIAELGARKLASPTGFLSSIFAKFEDTDEFRSLAKRTRADYKSIIDKKIAPKFADFPIKALALKQARGAFKEWRNDLALKSRRQADYAWTVLARILSVALDYGWIDANPCKGGGRLYDGTRAEKIWTDEHDAALHASASKPICEAHLLALGAATGRLAHPQTLRL